MAQAPHGRDAAKLAFGEKALGLVDSVLLFSQQELLPHVVLKLVLRGLLDRLGLRRDSIFFFDH